MYLVRMSFDSFRFMSNKDGEVLEALTAGL